MAVNRDIMAKRGFNEGYVCYSNNMKLPIISINI